jgi:hypothetical protein
MYEAAESRVEEHLERNPDHHYSDEDYEEAVKVQLPVMIGKIDCVDHGDLCQRMQIQAYPTLKFFVDGEEMGDYRGHRTVIEMAHFIAEMEKTHKGKGGVAQDATESECSVLKSWYGIVGWRELILFISFLSSHQTVASDRTIQTKEHEDYARALSASRHHIKHSWHDEDHPGCQISGFLLVDRAPGNFHIQAQSKGHDLAAHMTNVSHIINHLSFGKPFSKYFLKDGLKNTPPGFLETTKPFDGNVYITQNEHEAHHHYLKVITTEFEPEKGAQNSKYNKKEPSRAYQILQSSQLSLYRSDIVPGEFLDV